MSPPDAQPPPDGTEGGANSSSWAADGRDHDTAAQAIERLIGRATIAELLGALTTHWPGPGEYRCPICRTNPADPDPSDPTRWLCHGRWSRVVPLNGRAGLRTERRSCGQRTIWQLRRLVLDDNDALDRLVDFLLEQVG